MKSIVICDDETRSRDRWAKGLRSLFKRIGGKFTVTTIGGEDLLKVIYELDERRRNARRKSKGKLVANNKFDDVDILFVDFDLLKLGGESRGYLTGERVAYLARCYSHCGLIVGLNQFGTRYFDLSLKGHPESYADLNLGSEHLTNPGLWVKGWHGFRPWHWPLLPIALEKFDRRWKRLINHLDKKVLGHLGFPDETVRILPRSVSEFLVAGHEPVNTTFRGFVENSGNGLDRKDKAIDKESIARIAAARISKWMERLVLPGQDILVDGPHLASRFPSLVRGKQGSIAVWNKTTQFELKSTGLDHKKIETLRFKNEDWLSRPAWFWNLLSTYENIEEVSDPWSKEKTDFVFCEDASRFLRSNDTRQFVADLPSSFIRRFAVKPGPRGLGSEVKKIDYTPRVRFSL